MAKFSIYNRQNGSSNFPKASEELKITITFKDDNGSQLFDVLNNGATYGTVVGYMNKEFEYDANGNYTNIFDVKLPGGLIPNLFSDESQRNLTNYGYLSKKVYVHGDSPTLNLSFRCWSGDAKDKTSYYEYNNPINVANALVNATLPRVGKDNHFLVKTAGDALKEAVDVGGKILGAAIAGYKNLGIAGGNLLELASDTQLQQANSESNQATGNLIDSLELKNVTSKKPPVCLVKIGNFFEKDMMVVKTVSIKLSKEFLDEGIPLYGDFDVSLQSLFNSAALEYGATPDKEKIFGSGLNSQGSKNRVFFNFDNPQKG